jgi:hypothetical protein
LYRCEIWSLTLRGKHRLKVLENRALGRISGPKRDDIIGGWRKLNNEVLPSQNIIRMIKSKRMIRTGHVVLIGEKRNANMISVGKPNEKNTARKTHSYLGGCY